VYLTALIAHHLGEVNACRVLPAIFTNHSGTSLFLGLTTMQVAFGSVRRCCPR
jgi:hypothetical protein